MAETLHTAIAVPYTMPSSSSLTVTDSVSTRTITFPAAGVFRPFLAGASRTFAGTVPGTEADPYESGAYLMRALRLASSNTNWTVTMRSDGRWQITHNGTGTGSITWTSSVLSRLYGFTANVSLATGATAIATYQPTHFAASMCKPVDSGRTPMPRLTASARMTDGSVYGVSDGQHGSGRRFDLRAHPRDASLYSPTDRAGTPAYPTSLRIEMSPTRAITSSYALPWSLYETIRASEHVRIAVAFGNFQGLVAAGEFEFAEGYWMPETIAAGDALSPWQTYNHQRYDWKGLSLSHVLHPTNTSGMGSRV